MEAATMDEDLPPSQRPLLLPPTLYLDELTGNIPTAVVYGNAHKCTFSFVKFLKMR